MWLQVRLNGGTNIAAAVGKAGALLKADEETHSSDTRRVLVLLTGETHWAGMRPTRLGLAGTLRRLWHFPKHAHLLPSSQVSCLTRRLCSCCNKKAVYKAKHFASLQRLPNACMHHWEQHAPCTFPLFAIPGYWRSHRTQAAHLSHSFPCVLCCHCYCFCCCCCLFSPPRRAH